MCFVEKHIKLKKEGVERIERKRTHTMTLEEISSIYTWNSNIKAEKTVEIINDLKSHSEDGEQIF